MMNAACNARWYYASTGLPYPDTEVKIMDLQLGEIEMPPGKDGEIVVMGPQLMKGYLDDEETTDLIMKDGWLYTGDIGRFDENGYLYIVGRKNDRIVANVEQSGQLELRRYLSPTQRSSTR